MEAQWAIERAKMSVRRGRERLKRRAFKEVIDDGGEDWGPATARWDVMHNRVQSRGVRTRGFAAHITFEIETCGCCGLGGCRGTRTSGLAIASGPTCVAEWDNELDAGNPSLGW